MIWLLQRGSGSGLTLKEGQVKKSASALGGGVKEPEAGMLRFCSLLSRLHAIQCPSYAGAA